MLHLRAEQCALLKLHVFVCYFIELGLLVIAGAEAALFNRHDAPVAERLWL